MCAFLGHNGSGKSVTIGMMTGTVRQERGSCIIDGADTASDDGLACVDVLLLLFCGSGCSLALGWLAGWLDDDDQSLSPQRSRSVRRVVSLVLLVVLLLHVLLLLWLL